MELQSDISYQKNLKLLGTKQKAIVDGFENNNLIARLSSQAPEVDGNTYLDSHDRSLIGNVVEITINESDIYDLYGTIN